MPSKTIEDFANQVKSYALGIKDQQVLGAWNQLDYTASSQTINGVDFTVNADKTITVNIEGDAATDVAALELVPNGSPLPQNWEKIIGKQVYLNCFFSNGSLSTIWFFINCRNSSDVTIASYQYTGAEVPITIPEGTATIRMALAIAPAAGKLTNFIVKPMISLKPNQPYVPYAMTNRELTDTLYGTKDIANITSASFNNDFIGKYIVVGNVLTFTCQGTKIGSSWNVFTFINMNLPIPVDANNPIFLGNDNNNLPWYAFNSGTNITIQCRTTTNQSNKSSMTISIIVKEV